LTGYLVDTNVVSALEPGRQNLRGLDAGRQWLDENSPDLHISCMSVMEIESGIRMLVSKGSTRRSAELRAWLATILERYAERVLPFDTEVALEAGRMEAEVTLRGRNPGLADIIIGATAQAHGLVIVTRNLRHFLPLGVTAIDPFNPQPKVKRR
jgi:predicted nucleic acid-binding protein